MIIISLWPLPSDDECMETHTHIQKEIILVVFHAHTVHILPLMTHAPTLPSQHAQEAVWLAGWQD